MILDLFRKEVEFDVTAVIGCKEGDGFCDFVWVSRVSRNKLKMAFSKTDF
jgi:hypothetical protein